MKTISTRDLLKRKNELEGLRDAVTEAQETLTEAKAALEAHDPDRPDVAPDDEGFHELTDELTEAVTDAESALESAQLDFGTDEQEELAELENLESEIGSLRDGETLIPESDFEDYARQFAEDCGDYNPNAAWPMSCINWQQAAEELSNDFRLVSYQGDDYYVRE